MSILRSKPATTTLRQLRASDLSSAALNSGIGTGAGGGSPKPVQKYIKLIPHWDYCN